MSSKAQALPNQAGRGEGGFTLIETSIALIILMVAGIGVASLFTYAIQYNTGANDRAMACAIAQQRMEFLRKAPFEDVLTGTENISHTGRPFVVATTVCNDGTAACGGSTNAKRITVRVTPQGAGTGWARSAVELISLRSATSFGPYFQ